MKVLTHLCRIFVGVLFIISGLIKLNDPVGFSFKLEEYFSPGVLNLEFLTPYALAIALIVVIFEVVVGVMLLVGFKRNFTVWSLLLMIGFFTFLTFYSAWFNKVTDCGCFGDALHLTPWQSFTKDVVLLVLILVLFFTRQHIKPLFPAVVVNIIVGLSLILCIYFGWYVLNHLPVIDFRAYKVGTNIQEGMSIPEGAAQSETEMVFIYKVNGVDTELTEKEVANVPADAVFVDRIDKVIKQGYVPPIHDFTLEFNGEDQTEALLNEPNIILVTSYYLEKASDEGLAKIEAFNQKAQAKGYKVFGVTASGEDVIQAKKKQFGITLDYYLCDATTLKTIERANPSIIVLDRGTIMQKKHWNDIDEIVLK